jgi:hypothetical protein
LPKPAPRPHRPPSQTSKTFLRNHLAGTIAIDFLTVPTVTFNILYVFFVLSLERRCVLHVNVMAHPYAAWSAQQIVEAIGAEIAPARLIVGERQDPRKTEQPDRRSAIGLAVERGGSGCRRFLSVAS